MINAYFLGAKVELLILKISGDCETTYLTKQAISIRKYQYLFI
ncbi:hypothetical protein B4166_1918 [Caldibacillus thermoamylovorans]|nr:hypothetical protein B4166_1918 [Caldibacillus thermoamylovorans]